MVDFTINSHGLQLLNFLKHLDICMLNGRGKDNYTYVSPRECSVIDYCLVPKEEYGLFSNFEVCTVSDLEEGLVYQDTQASDHSVLLWCIFHSINESALHTTNKESVEIIPIPNFKRVPIKLLSNREKDISHLSELLLSTEVTQRSYL